MKVRVNQKKITLYYYEIAVLHTKFLKRYHLKQHFSIYLAPKFFPLDILDIFLGNRNKEASVIFSLIIDYMNEHETNYERGISLADSWRSGRSRVPTKCGWGWAVGADSRQECPRTLCCK